jgi:hypothetical protein
VRRSGPTNTDLTVNYRIGGTASNGVDYVALPGQVTIPAGRHAARIEIIPIDDNLTEGIETVLLSVVPSPAVADGAWLYTPGFPSHAAAIIIDNEQPRPPSLILPDGMFHFCAPGTNGHSFTLRASADLVHWSVLCTNTVSDGAIHYVDPDAATFQTRFYQALPEPSYAPQE